MPDPGTIIHASIPLKFHRRTEPTRTCDFCCQHAEVLWCTRNDADRDICEACIRALAQGIGILK